MDSCLLLLLLLDFRQLGCVCVCVCDSMEASAANHRGCLRDDRLSKLAITSCVLCVVTDTTHTHTQIS